MKDKVFHLTPLGVFLAILVTLSWVHAAAQTTAAGEAVKANTPRAVQLGREPTILGKWNLNRQAGESGFSIEGGRLEEETKIMGITSVGKGIVTDPPDGKIPFQPWALTFRNDRWQKDTHPILSKDLDTNSKCYPSGEPHVMLRDGPLITKFPNYVVMQFEFGHQYRIIPTDGRSHLPSEVKLWFGDSRGHWEGSTLVVDVTNVNAYAWLGVVGDFFSDAAHLTERYTPIDANTMKYEVTISDPKVFTRPWTMSFTDTRAQVTTGDTQTDTYMVPQPEIWESACHEGNRNLVWRELAKQVGRTEAQPPKDAKGPEGRLSER